ncbi:hypothetical protein [Frondihabitans sp. VKM Ac-2883]|uniref:hypothetical protein n=1 Tax=Frondihabitans sp. VKM Ac-2883 TaxID=2783823 RepID=UPI00188D1F2B|nr:hypothetical protein [Frondihabitans sp. VKM Ac-2883]MBF4574680.1 hypothetical protein [Frondihabitans sp. VKM Ac-2883]
MTGEPLAVSADVEEVLGRDLTPDEQKRVDSILVKASELFRIASGQQFTPGETTNRLKVTGNAVALLQRPVTEVVSVTTDSTTGQTLAFDLFQQELTIPQACAGDFVRVTYRHGGEVPDLVRLTVAGVPAQVFTTSKSAAAGVTQRSETKGPFTTQETYAAWALGAAPRLSPDDLAIAQSFRRARYGAILTGYDRPRQDC